MSIHDDFKRVQEGARGMYADIDRALYVPGMYLECTTCGQRIEMAEGDAGRYTSRGWPKHCGYTMRLRRPGYKD